MTCIPCVFPEIRLQGTPWEIGRRFGQLTRERVLLHFQNQKQLMATLRPDQPNWWRAEVRRYLPAYEQLAPYFVEEIEGLANGVGLTTDEILLLNVRDELLASANREPPPACTSFGCSGEVTLRGQPILGQTKDTAWSEDLLVVLAMRQRERPDLLQLAYAGEFGVIGTSSSGMAVFGNSLYVKCRSNGRIPVSLLRRLALEANSVDEVIALADEHGITAPGCLVIGDRTGRAVALENAGHAHAVVEGRHGILAHANHVNSRALIEYEAYDEPERTISRQRQARLTSLLEAERGRLTSSLAIACLQDHEGYPDSICRHPVPGRDFRTTAAVVVEPAEGYLHAIRGLPCQGWAVTYSLT